MIHLVQAAGATCSAYSAHRAAVHAVDNVPTVALSATERALVVLSHGTHLHDRSHDPDWQMRACLSHYGYGSDIMLFGRACGPPFGRANGPHYSLCYLGEPVAPIWASQWPPLLGRACGPHY